MSMPTSTKKVHLAIPIGAPGGPTSLFADPPLWCGKIGDYKTPHTLVRTKTTCARCIERAQVYQEEVEYQRVMARREQEQVGA